MCIVLVASIELDSCNEIVMFTPLDFANLWDLCDLVRFFHWTCPVWWIGPHIYCRLLDGNWAVWWRSHARWAGWIWHCRVGFSRPLCDLSHLDHCCVYVSGAYSRIWQAMPSFAHGRNMQAYSRFCRRHDCASHCINRVRPCAVSKDPEVRISTAVHCQCGEPSFPQNIAAPRPRCYLLSWCSGSCSSAG